MACLMCNLFTFKKQIMQVPVFTLCYTAAIVSDPSARAESDRLDKMNRMKH
jgi:hypothetical protein